MVAALLAGRRVAVKEIIACGGVELTANTRVELPTSWRWPRRDADVIARLRGAGAELVPQSLTHEFAWGITTAQPDRPQATNPWRPTHVAGGSTGGGAAAVAAGSVWAAVGTDTGGSVRIPADWCGVVGWKPGMGWMSTAGVLPLAPSLDHVGFLTRTPADLVLLGRAVGLESHVVPSLARRRVSSMVSDAPADRAARDAVEAALAMLERQGMVRREPRQGLASSQVRETYTTVQMREARAVHRSLLGTWPGQKDHYGADVAARLEFADTLTDADEVRARCAREAIRHHVMCWFGDVDIVVTPTTGCMPPRREQPDRVVVDGVEMPTRDVVLSHTVLANLTGVPAVSVPVDTGRGNDAVRGVQLLVAPGCDALALRAAEVISSSSSRGEG
jgi:aspartyl-tRNA(Asn)/glutamyl-tRNA(Gln) amidotransferase subunit A